MIYLHNHIQNNQLSAHIPEKLDVTLPNMIPDIQKTSKNYYSAIASNII